MSDSLLRTAFDHHVWATLRLIDATLDLRPEDLATDVPGTRGPLIGTLRHLVESDAFDLFILTGDRRYDVVADEMALPELRGVMDRNGAGWTELIAGPLDAGAVVRELDETDGFQRWAPLGYRLAGTIDHGSDHRSQICTALTTIGVVVPAIGVFDLGLEAGVIREEMPES
jgi:uncharacterized damage-inducible protein DinB